MASAVFSGLQYQDSQHGWALDVGSFLAAWSTTVRGLIIASSPEARLNFVRYARLYTQNIMRRLADQDIKIDARVFEPKSLQDMLDAISYVCKTVRLVSSKRHCTFLLLGSATTYVELGMKPNMPQDYYQQLHDCANSALKQIYDPELAAELQPEAVRIELLRLRGNVDGLKRVLAATRESTRASSSKGTTSSQKGSSSGYERQLSSMMSKTSI